jgi:glycosyltransferase involved in cell wall biosynthesis
VDRRVFLISIILATHNGAARLPDLFSSFCEQINFSEIHFEFIAVDNASTDSTSKIFLELQLKLPWLKYVYEDQLGLNYARNRGISEAEGDFLIIIDDDIQFGKSWLSAYKCLFDSQSDLMLAGGRVSCMVPQEIAIPPWLSLDGNFSFPYITVNLELGEKIQAISLQDGVAMPVGANMAFRRDVFQLYGMFRTDLGLKGNSLMPGAEFEYFRRLANYGLSWYYLPLAQVYHPIKSSQMNKSYFLKRTFGVGRVAAKTEVIPGSTRKIGSVPLFCFRLLLENTFLYITTVLSTNHPKTFYRKAQIFKTAGMIYEYILPRKN